MIRMPKEFVIHIHSGFGELHYDLMLATGEALATWQLSQSPADLAEGRSTPARRLKDHRTAYLSYEGPVSRGRGRVTMLDKGTYELLAATETRWELLLIGRRIRGRFVLQQGRADPREWSFRWVGSD